jgi:uncharacterized membrane protein YdfJ with MMPL/SSD domain
MLACFGWESTAGVLIAVFAVLSGFMSGLLLMFARQIQIEIRTLTLMRPFFYLLKRVAFPAPPNVQLQEFEQKFRERIEWMPKGQLVTFSVAAVIVASSIVTLLLASAYPLVHLGWWASGAIIGAIFEEALSQYARGWNHIRSIDTF